MKSSKNEKVIPTQGETERLSHAQKRILDMMRTGGMLPVGTDKVLSLTGALVATVARSTRDSLVALGLISSVGVHFKDRPAYTITQTGLEIYEAGSNQSCNLENVR